MAIVVLKLPAVKRKTEERPRKCRYCAGNIFQRWGQMNKPVKDVRVRNVKVYRYRCCHCKRTFRHYPEGNTSADQTERLKLFAVLLWTLGLSHRASSLILSGLQVMISFMTIWRDVPAEAQKMEWHENWLDVGWRSHHLNSMLIGSYFCLFLSLISPTAYVTETHVFAYCNEGRLVQ